MDARTASNKKVSVECVPKSWRKQKRVIQVRLIIILANICSDCEMPCFRCFLRVNHFLPTARRSAQRFSPAPDRFGELCHKMFYGSLNCETCERQVRAVMAFRYGESQKRQCKRSMKWRRRRLTRFKPIVKDFFLLTHFLSYSSLESSGFVDFRICLILDDFSSNFYYFLVLRRYS